MNHAARDLLQLYENTLSARGIRRIHAPDLGSTDTQRLGNMRFLIDKHLHPDNDVMKALVQDDVYMARFCGLVQGVLYCEGFYSLGSVEDQAKVLRTRTAFTPKTGGPVPTPTAEDPAVGASPVKSPLVIS